MKSLVIRAEAQRHLNNLELIKGYINSHPELFISSVLPDPSKWVEGEIAAIELELKSEENEKAALPGDLNGIANNSIKTIIPAHTRVDKEVSTNV